MGGSTGCARQHGFMRTRVWCGGRKRGGMPGKGAAYGSGRSEVVLQRHLLQLPLGHVLERLHGGAGSSQLRKEGGGCVR